MWISSCSWNTGPAFYPHKDTGRFMEVCPTSLLYVCFVDFEKAFDHDPWMVLRRVLWENGVPGQPL